ncbi:Alpha/Beta hydrolase protein [Cantharellus anzutake]|uniref:Alpha/Beta hydrolase protein n=1 Tax=Cantharellus anzutake TaxID=1750568 RepID=UPI0019089989|nr:Alpha/Beta hydrolase protein [Cantharellus anzutake]KAF8342998.1 Alpha/Beta hydrolase protein [Cantharellus anzutake]
MRLKHRVSILAVALAVTVLPHPWVDRLFPVVKLPQGKVVGKRVSLDVNTGDNPGGLKDFQQDFFLGIPYALPPLDKLRFKAPQPIQQKSFLTIEAKEYGRACMQTLGVHFHNRSEISEDCLTLNIIRPAHISKKAALPVLVWIHGGSFVMGSGGVYNGSWLVARSVDLNRPIIYVSMNYRLQLFGFLAAPEVEEREDADLNVGLLDQREALRWVKQNIASFGGDPSRITVFGQSAGAMSVGAQMLWNKGTKDTGGGDPLFRGAILQSGGASGYPSPKPWAHEVAYRRFATKVGCGASTIARSVTHDFCPPRSFYNYRPREDSILSCLREVPVDTLFREATRIEGVGLKDHLAGLSHSRPWGVTQDATSYYNKRRQDGGFFYARPSIALRNESILNIPIIIGTTLDEGTIFPPNNIKSQDDFMTYIQHWFIYPHGAHLREKVFKGLSSLYPDIPSLGSPYPNNDVDFDQDDRLFPQHESNQFRRAASVFGDLVFDSARRLQAEIMSDSVPVWTYQFRTPVRGPKHYGVGHSAEIPYAFGYYAFQGGGDRAISRLMTSAWINFVYDLDPNGKRPDPFWPKYTFRKKPLLEFRANTTAVVKDDYRKDALKWMMYDEDWNYATGR